MLVCPVSKGPLKYDPAKDLLISEEAQLAYPVRNGIPIMLVDEALPYDPMKDGIPESVRADAAEIDDSGA